MAGFIKKRAVLALLCVTVMVIIVLGITASHSGLILSKSNDSAQVGTASLAQAIPTDSPPVLESVITSQATKTIPSINAAKTNASSLNGTEPTISSPIVNSEIASKLPETITKSDPGNTLDFNNLKLCNNQWGASLEENLNCAVYISQNNTFGWYWDRKSPLVKSGMNGVLPIYPSVRIGGSPWEKSNSVLFPVKVSDTKSLMLTLNYKYAAIPEGAYDFAYDMFLTDTDQPSSNPKRNAEVMIWIQRTLSPPDGCYKGDFSDGTNTFGLYSYVMADGRLYYAFVMKGQPLFDAQYKIDAKKLLDNLNLNSSWYIPGIELGNEVISGSGNIEITQFDITLNGHSS